MADQVRTVSEVVRFVCRQGWNSTILQEKVFLLIFSDRGGFVCLDRKTKTFKQKRFLRRFLGFDMDLWVDSQEANLVEQRFPEYTDGIHYLRSLAKQRSTFEELFPCKSAICTMKTYWLFLIVNNLLVPDAHLTLWKGVEATLEQQASASTDFHLRYVKKRIAIISGVKPVSGINWSTSAAEGRS